MKTIFLTLMTAILMFAIGFVAYGREKTWETLFGNADTWPVDFDNLKRTGKPNDALICSVGFCPSGQVADATLPLFDAPPALIIERINDTMRNSGQIYKQVDDRSDPNSIRFVTWSNLMRFPDINVFTAIATNDGKTALLGYAGAQVGYSDAGANLKRLNMLIRNVAQ